MAEVHISHRDGDCVCRMLGDPVVTRFDADYLLLIDALEYILSQKNSGDCQFKISTKVGYYGSGGLLVPEYLEVELDDGNAVIRLLEEHKVDFIKPALGWETASGAGYSKQVTANVRVYRNGDFVVVEDSSCKTKVGYDSEGLGTKATIVVDCDVGTDLTGQCGECKADYGE